jgi:hypothetical protein
MNISSNQLRNLKLDGKPIKSKLDPFETFITVKGDLKFIEYNEDELIEIKMNDKKTENQNIVDGIENLLLM